MLPWLAFGHMIPFFHLSLALAKQGIRISFVSTPKNITRLPKVPAELAHLINLVKLPLPNVATSNYILPNDAEATVDLLPENVQYLKIAYDLLAQPFKQFVSGQLPDWIIVDLIPHWAVDVAQECGVPLIFFSAYNAAALAFVGPPEFLTGDAQKRVRPSPESLTISPEWISFRSSVAFRMYEAIGFHPGLYGENASEIKDAQRVASVIQGCYAMAIRSCPEVEGEYLNLLGNIFGKPVIPVGLLPPAPPGERENVVPWNLMFNWLDKQKARSVVFVGFGSECKLSKDQVNEIAYGLEMSELFFIWVLQKPDWTSHDVTTATPPGFTQRTAEKGVVHVGWAPQKEILAHPSIGGSLFHCGWGSVIETLQYGHCLVALPFVFDQGLTARMLVDKGLAIEVERREDGSFSRDDIAKSLRQAMVSNEGENLRNNAKEVALVFGDQKLHQEHYIGEFAQFLKNGIVDIDGNTGKNSEK